MVSGTGLFYKELFFRSGPSSRVGFSFQLCEQVFLKVHSLPSILITIEWFILTLLLLRQLSSNHVRRDASGLKPDEGQTLEVTVVFGQTFFVRNPCELSLLHLKLHGLAFSWRKILSVAPLWGTWFRMHYWWDSEEKKPGTQRNSNPQPLCPLPLCHNHCPSLNKLGSGKS